MVETLRLGKQSKLLLRML
ncbi:UNVERIFIED_CONTAM: hypothetical protein GTU68_066219 [Idotea baltica]|nr:hypothetical protein [Idotea baltica]